MLRRFLPLPLSNEGRGAVSMRRSPRPSLRRLSDPDASEWWQGLPGRPASESGRLRHGDGGHEGGSRCRSGRVLTILSGTSLPVLPLSAERLGNLGTTLAG